MASGSASSDFQSSLNYVDGTSTFANQPAISVGCWVNSDDLTSNFLGLVCRSNGTAGTDTFFLQNNSLDGTFRFRCDSNNTLGIQAVTAVKSTGTWYFVVGTADWALVGNEVKVWVNGVNEGSGGGNGSVVRNVVANVRVGDTGYSEVYNGRICFVGGWHKALTAEEQVQEMYMPGTIVDSQVMFYFLFDAPATALDLSGNGNDGTRGGTAATSSDGPPVFFLGGQ